MERSCSRCVVSVIRFVYCTSSFVIRLSCQAEAMGSKAPAGVAKRDNYRPASCPAEAFSSLQAKAVRHRGMSASEYTSAVTATGQQLWLSLLLLLDRAKIHALASMYTPQSPVKSWRCGESPRSKVQAPPRSLCNWCTTSSFAPTGPLAVIMVCSASSDCSRDASAIHRRNARKTSRLG